MGDVSRREDSANISRVRDNFSKGNQEFLVPSTACPAHNSAFFPGRAAQSCSAFSDLPPAGGETRADCGDGIMPGRYTASGE